jgi:amidase
MQRITRDNWHVAFDRNLPPVARVRPGEHILVECEDARGGRTLTPESVTPAVLKQRDWPGNPVTGPIFVEGAQPGDTLAVTIHRQEIASRGWIPIWPFLFHFHDLFTDPRTVHVDIVDGEVVLDSGRRVPVRPMIGTIGTAPKVEVIMAGSMGRHGGNLDSEEIRAGSTIYLPVEVEGALLSLGDAHAVQSDGELASVEVRTDVEISCEVISGRSPAMTWPRIDTGDALVVVAVGRPLEEALQGAFRDLIKWVSELTGMSWEQAYQLIGLAGHARPGQAQVDKYSFRCMIEKKYL